MKNHKFYMRDETGNYMVLCSKTSGTFCTSVWIKKDVQKNWCPCCEQFIKNGKQT